MMLPGNTQAQAVRVTAPITREIITLANLLATTTDEADREVIRAELETLATRAWATAELARIARETGVR